MATKSKGKIIDSAPLDLETNPIVIAEDLAETDTALEVDPPSVATPAPPTVEEVTITIPLKRHKGGYCAGRSLGLNYLHRETLRDIFNALEARGAEITTRPAVVKDADGETLNEDGEKVFVKAGAVVHPVVRRKVTQHVDDAWILERIEAQRT